MSRVLVNGQDVNYTSDFPEMTYDKWKALPEDLRPNYTVITDRDYTGEPLDISVSVTADGVKTWATLLNELFALVDMSRVTRNSCVIEAGESIYRIDDTDFSTRMRFTTALSTFSSPNYYLSTMNVKASDSNWSVTANSVTNKGNIVPTLGTTLALYYNIVSSGGAIDISADDVSYGSGTVKDALDDLSTLSTALTFASGNATYVNNVRKTEYAKVGKVVTFTIFFDLGASPSNGSVLFTINDSKLFPKIYSIVPLLGVYNNTAFKVDLSPNGNIEFNSTQTVSAGSLYSISGTYICVDE